MNYFAYSPSGDYLGHRHELTCDACGRTAAVLVVFERWRGKGKTVSCRACAPPPVGTAVDGEQA